MSTISNSRLAGQTQIQCEHHPGEIVTNFDCHPEHLKPLCPECIDNHNRLHKQQQTFPQIESIKNVKNNCSKKLKTGIQLLNDLIDKLEKNDLLMDQDLGQQGLEQIKFSREKVIDLVNNYFNQLEEEYQNKLQVYNRGSEEVSDLLSKCRNLINDLEHQNVQMDTNSQINVVKKVCVLDLTKTIDKLKKDAKKLADNHNIYLVDVYIDESRLKMIHQELTKYAQLGNTYPTQQTPTVNLTSTSVPHTENAVQNIQPISNFQQSQVGSPEKGSRYIPNQQGVTLNMKNTFEIDHYKQCIHFFQPQKKILYLVELQAIQNSQQNIDRSNIFRPIHLNNDFNIYNFHKSLALPDGSIYLTGGSIDKDTKSRDIYIYDHVNEKLIKKNQMTIGRSSHSITNIGKQYILIIGGFTDGQRISNRCDLYDVVNNKVIELPKTSESCVSAALCAINNNVFRFGGLNETLMPSQTIECFNLDRKEWRILSYSNPFKLRFTSTPIAIPLNNKQIIVCGGYDENNEATTRTILVNLNEKLDIEKGLELPFGEGFWNNQGVIESNVAYCLENLTDSVGENCLEHDRRILTFNGAQWKAL